MLMWHFSSSRCSCKKGQLLHLSLFSAIFHADVACVLVAPQINVYTTPGRKDQGHFALEVASKIIPFFVDYFGIDYPLPKADLIGE